MHRRDLLVGAGALTVSFSLPVLTQKAFAANAAEDFVSGNILKGFDILNDTKAAVADRQQRFATFLLGSYAEKSAPADLDDYVVAYREYLMSVYQAYFALYAGQSLRVVSSREHAPGDYVVTTEMTGGKAMPIDFRVRTDGAAPLLLDVAVSGVWLALAQRAQFTSVLAQNSGDVKALSVHLRRVAHT